MGSYTSTKKKRSDAVMPLYVVLGKYTDKGKENMKDSPKRLEAAGKVMKSVGGELKEFLYTNGQYDFVAKVEAPSDEAMTKAGLIVQSVGAVRMEVMTAIPAAKEAEIIKTLP